VSTFSWQNSDSILETLSCQQLMRSLISARFGRCAADVPGSDSPPTCSGKVCGKFQAPEPHKRLGRQQEWRVFDGSFHSSSPGTHITEAVSGAPAVSLQACSGSQTIFSWNDTLGHQHGSSAATCLAGHSSHRGIVFNVSCSGRSGKLSKLAVWAGANGAAMITASLVDGAEVTIFKQHVNTTFQDVISHVTTNLRLDLTFTPKTSTAVMMINVSSPVLSLAPPPPPPPPPKPASCTQDLCGMVTKHNGDVDLSAVGISDWTHYGFGGEATSVNRKCATASLIAPLQKPFGVASFNNCPQTFSWRGGGFDRGAPAVAQIGSAHQTPSAIFTGTKGTAFNFSVTIPPVTAMTNVYVYVGSCSSRGILQVQVLDSRNVVQAKYHLYWD
jgi:hypothetical protein